MVAKIPAAGVSLDGAVVVNESSAAVDTRIESNANTHMLFVDGTNNRVGVGTTPDLGTGLHIRTSDGGGAVHANGDNLVIEQSDKPGMSFVSGTSGFGTIYFSDGADANAYRGFIQYGHTADQLIFGTSSTTHMKIDSIGAVTKPLQPAFLVTKSGAQSNVSNGNTITWDSEVYDQNADFASNTFTAPVTGRYLFAYQIRIDALASNMTYALFNTQTSNRTYQNIYNTQTGADVTTIFRNFTGSIVADMDANDTCIISYGEAGGSVGTADVDGSVSFWSGTLLC